MDLNQFPLIATILEYGQYILIVGVALIALKFMLGVARRVVNLGCSLIVILGAIFVVYRLLS
jgi:hypothetical protein